VSHQKLTTWVGSGAIFAVLFASVTIAHHSNAMFDRSKELLVTGTVREFQWTNPHVFIELVVEGANGPYNYSIETGAPGVLRAHGWKFNSLKAGDKVVARVYPLKSGGLGGGLISVSKNGVVVGDATASPGYEGGK
jgi:hypothetical protein